MKNCQLVVATDLDGTFLEGDHGVKNSFYPALSRSSESVMLVYTTGRPVETVYQFCQRGYLPYPHFVIGDHGTHVVDGKFSPIEALQNPIINTWNSGNQKLKALLKEEQGIQLQPIDPPYRVAYYYNPRYLQAQTLNKITDAGFDYILSCDHYLDIVPRGVNKGSTLLKLLDHLLVNRELAVTFGDSMNDLSLFETGLKSVAVGNSESKLVTKIQSLNNVYHSSFPGLLGVIDGLRFYNKMELIEKKPNP